MTVSARRFIHRRATRAVAVRLAAQRSKHDQMEEWLYTHQPAKTPPACGRPRTTSAASPISTRSIRRSIEDVKSDTALGKQLGVKSTPTFFINGVKVEGALPPQYFDQAIAYELQHATPPSDVHALATFELTKEYAIGFWRKRPYRALDRLSLEVEPGEVFGFLGPNGAGKTTTLKLLMQLVFPTRAAPRSSGARSAISTRSAASATFPRTRTSTTTSQPRSCCVTSRSCSASAAPAADARVSALLDEVGIARERRLQLRKFSKGMLQRVGIAQALINEPELVILDEPMSGLDPLGRRDVRALILRLRDRGCTVFFSSHVLSDAEALCNRVAILAKGRLVAERAPHRHAGVPRARLGARRRRRERRS